MHARSIEGLRKYYGLEYRPVKVTRLYQMLGEIENDLMEIMGVDTLGILPAALIQPQSWLTPLIKATVLQLLYGLIPCASLPWPSAQYQIRYHPMRLSWDGDSPMQERAFSGL